MLVEQFHANKAMHATSLIYKYGGERLCTNQLNPSQRFDWFSEVIAKKYTRVNVNCIAKRSLFNDMTIYPWSQGIKLSLIHSQQILLERFSIDSLDTELDCYFFVLLLSGEYQLQQAGRQVALKPGNMTVYDAAEAHKVSTPSHFSKILISIPRYLIDERLKRIHELTATTCSAGVQQSYLGVFIQSVIDEMQQLTLLQYQQKAGEFLDRFITSLDAQLDPLSHSATNRQLWIKIQGHVQRHLEDEQFTPQLLAEKIGVSRRFLNKVFYQHQTSPMRYIMEKRFERARYLLNDKKMSITEVALQAGIGNFSYFSRQFKASFGLSPRDYRRLMGAS